MRYFIPFVMALLLVACGKNGCENAGGGTVARKPTAYKGDPTANDPYIETGKIWRLRTDWAGLRPTIHNPTTQEITVKIACQYWLDGIKAAESKTTKDVTVPKRASRKFEGFDYLIQNWSSRSLGLAARCTATFLGYPERYSDAVQY